MKARMYLILIVATVMMLLALALGGALAEGQDYQRRVRYWRQIGSIYQGVPVDNHVLIIDTRNGRVVKVCDGTGLCWVP